MRNAGLAVMGPSPILRREKETFPEKTSVTISLLMESGAAKEMYDRDERGQKGLLSSSWLALAGLQLQE